MGKGSAGQKYPLHAAAHMGDAALLKVLLKIFDVDEMDEEGAMALHHAAARGQHAAVELLLQHTHVDAKTMWGGTALFLAAHRGHVEIVQLLLNQGANVDARDNYIRTPLHVACWRGDPTIAQLLIGHGADVNAQAKDQQTSLHIAASGGRIIFGSTAEDGLWGDGYPAAPDYEAVVRLLIAHATIDAQNRDGKSALYLAVEYTNELTASVLVEHANVTLLTTESWSPIELAMERGNPIIAALLFWHADWDVSYERNEALYFAAYYKHDWLIKEALELAGYRRAGARPHSKRATVPAEYMVKGTKRPFKITITVEEITELVFTALKLSFYSNRWPLLGILMRYADLNTKNKDGATPLQYAVSTDNARAIRLLRLRADVNARDQDGRTMLHLAMYSSRPDVAQFLVPASDLTLRDNDGSTVLHLAIRARNIPALKFLIGRVDRAMIDAKDKFKHTPLDWAVRTEFEEAVDLLLDAGALAGWDVGIGTAKEMGSLMVSQYRDKYQKVERQWFHSWTPLHQAANIADLEKLEAIIEARSLGEGYESESDDFKLDVKDLTGKTPLHLAARNGDLEVVKILLQNGADAEAKDNDGQRPVDLASDETRNFIWNVQGGYLTEDELVGASEEELLWHLSRLSSNEP